MSSTQNPYALMNETNREFWAQQSRRCEELNQDLDFVRAATHDLQSEESRLMPLAWRKQYWQALEDASRVLEDVRVEFARKGGRAAKSDRLQQFIMATLERRPQITEAEMLKLVLEQHEFEREDDCIAFDRRDGTVKLVPIRGLKDRLSRAKKKLHSR